ncbi:glycosyltransferase [Oryzifoliimicrobium ureilyticus]|uniref:glycosyltransferase n=1 Tax=Oryzifoliimicrobium ureilyticus TaxID=3113724 RepID=UPI00307601E9
MSNIINSKGSVDAGVGRQSALMTAKLLVQTIGLNKLRIRFKREDDPIISVVIVSYNAPTLLAMTLWNLAAHVVSSQATFEVIIVDNASEKPTREILDLVDNAKIILNDKNEGFGPACNRGVSASRGRYLLMLNPDVDLLPGCLDAMVAAFGLFDNTGIVGARLVFPGGILQEAGASFIDDRQLTHPYLRGVEDASIPEALFARETSYVSGAVLMIESRLFEALGGFDDIFAPAYFEDTDLCLRAAQIGKKVVYQPRAVALHYENATSPNREDVERLLNQHRTKLLDRHRNWLFGSGVHPDGFMLREPDRNRFRVLYVDDQTPHIDKGAGLPRANTIIQQMVSLGYFVTVLPLYHSDPDPIQTYRDIDQRVEVLDAAGVDQIERIIVERRGYYDLLWISRPHNVDLIVRCFKGAGISVKDWVKRRVIFDTEALFSVRDAVLAFKNGASIDNSRLVEAVKNEVRFSSMADAVVCVSRSEERLLKDLGGVVNTRILGHTLPLNAGSASFSERKGILFIGPLTVDGSPNVDSVDWFLNECWKDVRNALSPEVELHLVGEISEEIRARFDIPGVRIYGRVDNPSLIFNAVRLSIAPTRFAAGIPQKVHNCVSHGVPMVVSPLLLSQLDWEEGEGCTTAPWTDPSGFSQAVIALHENSVLWQDIRARGLEKIEEECSEITFRQTIRQICEEDTWV